MMSSADNEVLVRTSAGTPMGEYFRRYWLPFALSRELPEPDGAPIRVKVMGEELVAFRDTNGRVGLVEPRCAHRGTNLFFGRNEECGLRCIHHGWKYDVDGKCVDMPNVPRGASMQDRVSIKAYPTREFGEMVWAYLGPKETAPQVPQLEHGLLAASQRYVTKRLQQCNWAQSMDGALDTAHFSFLHMPAPSVKSNDPANIAADENRIRWLRADPMPQFTIVDHDVGFVLGGSRKADGRELYWRITQFMLPSHSITPSAMPGEIYYGYTWVPVDDESCWIYVYGWHPERAITSEERAKFEKGGFGQFAELGPGYVPVRNRGNDYLIDRDDQKHRSFTGVRGIAEQDTLAQESQGLIADRTREHLTATDVGVVHFRRLMLREAKALVAGTEPAAPRRHASYRLRSGGALLDAGLSFEEVMRQRFGTATGAVP
ncbi:MAG TPA: Rieske 2Fe-2S domain-containing protein [Burkholderiales bacterium]|jgi:phenylpropionate dioxygenase-like ring-hydroxylating dioxygenase large terminal subunit|nr:Rieske 2Fe-2S domain-containing protein [Burkholderiales bacterium]